MTARKFFLFLSICLSTTFCATAQYYEAGIMIGTSNYFGDIHPDGLAPKEYNMAYGLFGRYNINRFFAFKASLFQGTISGSDSNNTLRSGLRERNLNFKTSVIELAVTNEFHLAPLEIRKGNISVPYLFAGIGAFYFNPQAELDGTWHNLQPLGTEGQGTTNATLEKYSRVSVAIPFGFGMKISINEQINIGVEMGMRKTITDYLDDVSSNYPDIDQLQNVNPLGAALAYRTPEFYSETMENPVGTLRGNPDDQDWYFMGGVTVSINLTNQQGLEWERKYKKFEGMKREKKTLDDAAEF